MILLQERITINSVAHWVDLTTIEDDAQAKQWIENDGQKREAYRLLPLSEEHPVREVDVKVAVRFVPSDHQFKFDGQLE